MTDEPTASRLGAAVIGMVMVGCAIAIFVVVPRTNVAGLLAGGVILLLGADALAAAVTRRRSILSRIGPLP